MEILIIGGVVVLIMVFVSTQIKKSAALAFERETIDTDEFTIVKPDGFVNPIREDSEYLFEAYSKGYGEQNERNFWKAQVYLTASAKPDFTAACEQIEQESDRVLSKKLIENASEDKKICLLESEKTEDEVEFSDFWKIVESRRQQKIYNLRIKVLKSSRDEYLDTVSEIINNFHLK